MIIVLRYNNEVLKKKLYMITHVYNILPHGDALCEVKILSFLLVSCTVQEHKYP